jgi:nitroreductase
MPAFLPEPVPEESIERIVRTILRCAPSGGFSQGQSLVVVTDPDTRRRSPRRSTRRATSPPGVRRLKSEFAR